MKGNSMKSIYKINKNDNIVVALSDLNRNEIIYVDSKEIKLQEDVKEGHKIAISKIKANQNVVKYGFPIGHATSDILEGQWIHSHNIKTNLNGIKEYTFNQKLVTSTFVNKNLSFMGYRRENNQIGIRNEIWIVPTVGCINGVADKIIEKFNQEAKNVYADNVMVIKHNYGCSQLGGDHINTRTILSNLAKHPNAGGVLILSLGCENNNIDEFKESLGEYNGKRIKFLVAQEKYDEVDEGAKLLNLLNENMRCDKRVKIPLSELKIGLKCGASDAFSGITANPLLGKLSDFLISQGGTTILTEVPEMFGAETLLMERANDKEVFNKIVGLINEFKEYFMKYNQPIYENPSPGNRAGGITTLEEKSLGCVQKSGSSKIVDVLKYGEIAKISGLNLLSAPGNDIVACSALGAAGCHMVLFTTGRGTPFGSFVPTIKISSNNQIYNLKPHWIDFNAGALIEEVSIDKLMENIISYIIKTASGELTNNELNNFREIAIFKSGVTL
jgi:altronate hydrolase